MNIGTMLFSIDELKAIHLALELQIDYCNEALKDPDFDSVEKAAFSDVLHGSVSAITKLDAIFKEIEIDPPRGLDF